jgi:predicted enzyme related to lactoylglutathione lyase
MGAYQLFSAGGQTIGGMFSKPSTVPIPFWLYYFNIGDIDAAAKRVKAGGGQILEGPLEV